MIALRRDARPLPLEVNGPPAGSLPPGAADAIARLLLAALDRQDAETRQREERQAG